MFLFRLRRRGAAFGLPSSISAATGSGASRLEGDGPSAGSAPTTSSGTVRCLGEEHVKGIDFQRSKQQAISPERGQGRVKDDPIFRRRSAADMADDIVGADALCPEQSKLRFACLLDIVSGKNVVAVSKMKYGVAAPSRPILVPIKARAIEQKVKLERLRALVDRCRGEHLHAEIDGAVGVAGELSVTLEENHPGGDALAESFGIRLCEAGGDRRRNGQSTQGYGRKRYCTAEARARAAVAKTALPQHALPPPAGCCARLTCRMAVCNRISPRVWQPSRPPCCAQRAARS